MNAHLDFDTLATQLTPMALRRPLWLRLMGALLAPVKRLGSDHEAFRAQRRLRLQHNGQVRLLERIANLLMLGGYDPASPHIRIDEDTPPDEFLASPDGLWLDQGRIFSDQAGQDEWDFWNRDLREHPESYTLLHDHASRTSALGFVVRLDPMLGPLAPDNDLKRAFRANGGTARLARIVDTYKLAGKHYTITYDQP